MINDTLDIANTIQNHISCGIPNMKLIWKKMYQFQSNEKVRKITKKVRNRPALLMLDFAPVEFLKTAAA
jgi:hypothetical protein